MTESLGWTETFPLLYLWSCLQRRLRQATSSGPQQPDRMPEDMPDRLSDRMPEDMPDKMP